MAVDFVELLEVIEALPVDKFIEVDDKGEPVERDLDASMFVDSSAAFMKAMKLAKKIQLQLGAET